MGRHAGIAAVLLVQLGILAAIPFRKARARWFGVEITLETEPVDPFDPLAGYFVTLAYAAERAPAAAAFEEGESTWVNVVRAQPAWRSLSVERAPRATTPDSVSIRATWSRGRARLDGAGRLYIPETQRQRVETLLSERGQRALVVLRVGEDGTAAVLEMRIAGDVFGR